MHATGDTIQMRMSLANPGDVIDKAQTLRPWLGPGRKHPFYSLTASDTDLPGFRLRRIKRT